MRRPQGPACWGLGGTEACVRDSERIDVGDVLAGVFDRPFALQEIVAEKGLGAFGGFGDCVEMRGFP